MSPTGKRNLTNGLILLGLVPVLFWLNGLGLILLYPDELLPWTVAGIIMLGAPLGLLSLLFTVPTMIYARSRASQNSTVWGPIHRVPFYFGLVTFGVALAAGVALTVVNMRR